jgi:hypothetical protein
MKNFVVIADYCLDTLTQQELRSALNGFITGSIKANPSFVNSTPNTIHTAFLLKQVLQVESNLGDPNNLVIFVNTDPRLQTTKGVEKAKGAEFIIARMKNGAWVCGPNAGNSFSLIIKDIFKLYLYPNFDKGSQFRSRDLYMRVCAHLIEEKQDEMEFEEVRNNIIPDLEDFHVGHIDNYGNIKTVIPHSYMKGKHEYGEIIKVEVGGQKKEAYYVENLFGKEPGKLVIYPGSSGAKDDPYLELAIWQHMPLKSALLEFTKAAPGQKIVIS